MTEINTWQKLLGVSTLIPLTVIAIPTLSKATISSETNPKSKHSKAQQNYRQYQLAQASDTCRRVSASYGLNIREQPTSNSAIVGVLANEARINIEGRGSNGWVPISEPREGYVSADYLKYCGSVPPSVSCRQISAYGGLNVRRNPTTNSPIIRTLENGRYVTTEFRPNDDWVQISAPVSGYVASDYLNSCPVRR